MPFADKGETKVVVGPLNLTVRQGTMPPGEIRLWPDNPRIKHLVAQFETWPDESDLMAVIERVARTAYRNLYRDIQKFGQQEAVFLRPEESDGRVETATVIEGNTRVAILKDLHSRFPKEGRYALVKAYLLPEDFDENDLAILMANYHVKGTLRNQWDRYQIGAFLYEHIEAKHHFNQNEMAEHIGKSPSWVSRHLTVYRFAQAFKDELEGTYGLSPGHAEEETNKNFSKLEEAWKVKAFREETDRSPDALDTLFRWVHEGKFRDHRAVRAIYEIYANPTSRQAVDAGGVGAGDDAAGKLDKALPLHDDLDRLLRRIEAVQLADLDSIDRNKVKAVLDALTNLDSMIQSLRRKR